MQKPGLNLLYQSSPTPFSSFAQSSADAVPRPAPVAPPSKYDPLIRLTCAFIMCTWIICVCVSSSGVDDLIKIICQKVHLNFRGHLKHRLLQLVLKLIHNR